MFNSMHVNEKGNILIGLHVLTAFGIDALQISHREKLLPAREHLEDVRNTTP